MGLSTNDEIVVSSPDLNGATSAAQSKIAISKIMLKE
jgi:hypothetical protein